ncbi:hypothetical protein [Acinetobacter bouvetii]|uniref:Uncharacterized protein n=1 Tax=Acinetobacter bouvetii TaxID=202951 RepID=A0A811G9S7_9GAMM|nr:hypothetical protein [Acinetobacter bouvetii]CAB1213154.1 hypothetical protein SFB21_1221 [Acinetobacter bouvetii]
MKFKELSITEFVSLLTIVALSICVITQTYFYYRLDALWVMSLIPPSIYLLDVIKVIAFIFVSIFVVFGLESIFGKITKKNRHKIKIRYENIEEIRKLLIKNRKSYENNLLLFICLIVSLFGFFLIFIGIKISMILSMVFGAMIGTILILNTDKSLTRNFKLGLLGGLLIVGAVIIGEFKYAEISNLPKVTLVADSEKRNLYHLLEQSKTNAVIFKRDKNGANSFKIVDLNQIHSIQSVTDN